MRHCVIFLVSIASVIATAQAQDFHAGVLYECTGPVKEFKIKTKNPYVLQKKIKFLKDGKLNRSMLTYDAAGYPIGCDLTFGKRYMSVGIQYDSINQPVVITLKSNLGVKTDVTVRNNYTDKVLTECSFISPDKEDKNIRIVYTDQVFDSHGNWISRKATATKLHPEEASNGQPDNKPEEYLETREIKYYAE